MYFNIDLVLLYGEQDYYLDNKIKFLGKIQLN